MTKIKNINGTTNNICKCGSWLKHWEKFSRKNANCCSVKNCTQNDLVGAHVQKTNQDMNWYIIPLCKTHNASTSELDIVDTTIFVSANKSETCNKY